jgi:ABC-type transporter Mla MlaB component
MNKPSVECNDQCLTVKGALIFHTVMDVLMQSKASFIQEALTIDLAGVKKIDTSSLTLLCEWSRMAKAKSMTLNFINVPESLLHLAEVNNVKAILKL